MRRPHHTHVMVSFGVSVTVRSLRGRAVTYLVLTESSIMPDTYVRMRQAPCGWKEEMKRGEGEMGGLHFVGLQCLICEMRWAKCF